MQLNRNLKSNKLKAGKEMQTLLFGAAIAPALATFPTSRYDPAAVKVDVWQASVQALGINMSGIFQEVDERGTVVNRPFHRVLVLMLTKPGMPAHSAGWPAVIANEQLHVGQGVTGAAAAEATSGGCCVGALSCAHRGGGGGGGNGKGKGKGKGKARQGGGAGAAEASGGGPNLLQQFMAQTRLKPEVAQQCLVSNGGNLAKALFDFETLKRNGKLLPSYFL